MGHADQSQELAQRMQRLESLLQEIDATADAVLRDKTQEIVETLLDFHGAGLAAIAGHLQQAGAAGQAILATLAGDDLVRQLLLLYDLHPEDFEARVHGALEKVRPMLASHGGNVQLIECGSDGVLRLRLEGSCHGCPSSQMTLKNAIEEALYAAAPEIVAIHVEGVVADSPLPASAGFVPISALGPVIGAV